MSIPRLRRYPMQPLNLVNHTARPVARIESRWTVPTIGPCSTCRGHGQGTYTFTLPPADTAALGLPAYQPPRVI